MPRGVGAAPNIIRWIKQGDDWRERERRAYAALAREGYQLPERARNVDRSRKGQTIQIGGQDMTVRYLFPAKIDGKQVMIYHLAEQEVNHILLRRLEEYHEPAIRYLGEIPGIVRNGQIAKLPGRVFFTSCKKYDLDDLGQHNLRVVVRKDGSGIWYVDSFFPAVPR